MRGEVEREERRVQERNDRSTCDNSCSWMVGAQALRVCRPYGLNAIQAKMWPNFFELKNITQGLRTIIRQAVNTQHNYRPL